MSFSYSGRETSFSQSLTFDWWIDSFAATDTVVIKEDDSAQKALEEMLAKVHVGVTVTHKKFGQGTIVWIDNAIKHMRIKFSVGEKQFIFPDAFILGFLKPEI